LLSSSLERTATSNLSAAARTALQKGNVMWSSAAPLISDTANSAFLRRHARRLLRDARADAPSRSLPVLRWLASSGTTSLTRTADLHRARDTLQLKQVLRALALELGYTDWAACRHDIDKRDPALLDHYRVDAGLYGDFMQNWFPNEASARSWQREHGGYIVRYGNQAVAILKRD
jgi:hypothetical protein